MDHADKGDGRNMHAEENSSAQLSASQVITTPFMQTASSEQAPAASRVPNFDQVTGAPPVKNQAQKLGKLPALFQPSTTLNPGGE
jgi:hypothetical protein